MPCNRLLVIIGTVGSGIDIFVSSAGLYFLPPLIPVLVCSLLNVTQSRPAGVHEWLRMAAFETAVSETYILASSAGYFNIITLVYMKMNIASVGDTGHFHKEIDLAGSEGLEGMEVVNIKPRKTFSGSSM